MCGHQVFAVLCLLWLTCFGLGAERLQEAHAAKSASEGVAESVLRADDDSRTIIAKAVKAHGGEKSFTRWRCGSLKYKLKLNVDATPRSTVTLEDTFQLPGHFKRVTRADGLLTIFVVNHGQCWTKHGDDPAEPSDNKVTDSAEHTFASFSNLAPLVSEDVQLTRLETEKVNGKQAICIRAQSESLGEVEFWFELQSGLLLKSRKKLPGKNPAKPSVMEAFLEDYKDAQGTQVPMHIKGFQDGSPIIDVTFTEVIFKEKIEESAFAKP